MDAKTIISKVVRLVMKGAWARALEEQHQLLESEPRNLRALCRLAELYRKKGEPLVAAYYLGRVAERHVSYGYFIQAAGTYKQVLELDPRLPDTHLRLAELYQQIGLKSDALAYFRIVAYHYDTAGDVERAREVLEKMRALDPDNDTLRLKLAELAARRDVASPRAGRAASGPEGGRGDSESS